MYFGFADGADQMSTAPTKMRAEGVARVDTMAADCLEYGHIRTATRKRVCDGRQYISTTALAAANAKKEAAKEASATKKRKLAGDLAQAGGGKQQASTSGE